MGINEQIITGVRPSGTLAIAGAAPQTANGLSLSIVEWRVAQGTLAANVSGTVTTNLITLTGKWQVSDNGSTWKDSFNSNSAANVVIITGDGGADTFSRAVSGHDGLYGFRYVRYVITSGAAAGGGAGVDEVAISYNFRQE